MFSRLKWQLLLRVGVSATLIFWLVSSFNRQEAFKAISGINYLWIFGAALWIIGAVAVSVIKWRIILGALGLKRIINLVKGFLAEVHQQSNLIRQRPRVIIRVTLWSMVFQLCVGAVNYSIFRGLGVVRTSPC